MTHEGIMKVNEFFNNKLSKNSSNIKVQITYSGNFGNAAIFTNIRKIVRGIGYEDVKGQIDALYCLVDGIKNGDINEDSAGLYMSPTSKAYWPTKDLIIAIKKLLSKGKISFDDRIRRDALISFYLDSQHFNIKTSFLTLEQHKEIFNTLVLVMLNQGSFIGKNLLIKVDAGDLYQAIYDNAKTVLKNMSSRGISLFSIACYFWFKNRDFIATPFLNNWASLNFIQAVISTQLYQQQASDHIKELMPREKVYWTVFSELSLLTGRISNVHPDRKQVNQIINKVLDSEGEQYIKNYLRRLKLVGTSNPIATQEIPFGRYNRDALKQVEKHIQNMLRERSTQIPSKEVILESVKYQFMISRVVDVDFSSKRKDHLILDKGTRQRIFDIL